MKTTLLTFLTILCVLLAGVLLSACGEDAQTTAGEDTDPAAPNAPSEDDDPAAPNAPDEDTDPAAPDTPDEDTDTPLGAGPYAIADLTIVIRGEDDGRPAEVRLACLGDTATLVSGVDLRDPETACIALTDPSVVERLVNGPPDQMCTEIYGSAHTATITGTLEGSDVDTAFHRADGCGIDDWDIVMADLLPPVGG